MPSLTRIAPKLALCGVVAGLFLVGWAARHTAAQNPQKEVPPAVDQVGRGTTVKGEEPKSDVPLATPETRSEQASPLPAPGPADLLGIPGVSTEPPANPFDATTAGKAPAPVPVAPGEAITLTDDPDKVAIAFLEQNQKLAETHLKALKEEAAKLKARLLKVEAGIKRWDSLLVALKRSQGYSEPSQLQTQGYSEPAQTYGWVPEVSRRLRPVDTAQETAAPEELKKPPRGDDSLPPR
jgi:hypothetical protein